MKVGFDAHRIALALSFFVTSIFVLASVPELYHLLFLTIVFDSPGVNPHGTVFARLTDSKISDTSSVGCV
jgi:hypothetical protein